MFNASLLAGSLAALAALFASPPATSVRLVSSGGLATSIGNGSIAGSSASHAVLWSSGGVVDLHPAGFAFSGINARRGILSVGFAGTSALAQSPMTWVGQAAAPLTVPFAYVTGRAVATDGVQVVGFATESDPERGVGSSHALLWDVATGGVVDFGNDATLIGVGAGVQVGTSTGSRGPTAMLWRGDPRTAVALHVTGQDTSVACATNGAVQVGYVGLDVRVRHEGRPRDIRFYSAGVWTGSADSFVPLPSPYRHSFALAISGETIVGYGNTSDPIGTPRDSHAVAWVGSTRTFIDLHALLPADMRTSRATAVDEFGNIVGYGVTLDGAVRSYLWTLPATQPEAISSEP